MKSEEPFEVRQYLSKTLQPFTMNTASASEWFLSPIYLSLVGLLPTVGHMEKAVIPTRDFPSNANMLFRLMIYVENVENLTYIASTKTPGYPHLKIQQQQQQQQQPAILFHAVRNTSHTLAHTHTKENNEKLVLICPLSLYLQPSGPEALDFSRRLPRGQMVADKKEQGF